MINSYPLSAPHFSDFSYRNVLQTIPFSFLSTVILYLVLNCHIKSQCTLVVNLQVLEDSRQILVAANMQPDAPFPLDDKIKEAYSHVVENTAFFGDVALRFPRIVHHYYDRNADWGGLLRWGLNFCNQTGVFTGGAHQHVLTLMSQELGITEKSPDFINPYRTERDDVLHTAEAFQKILREEEKRRRKEEKRKEIRKGPRISRSRSEL
uniref:Uncharacterized protein n=1 Tax=Xiphophorus couchianus TaxID=32473 RepID=A0A3B5MJN0_9TELE